MTRPLRLHAPGLLHHVFARGSEKACIFADDRDCESSLELLANTLPRFQCRIVEDCAYARTVLRYLALNPVAAGRTAKPEDWRWEAF